MVNYYEEFGLDPNMTGEELCATLFEQKKTWSRKQNSPNLERRQEAERKLVRIDECTNIFSDEEKRKQYDAELRLEQQQAAQEQAQRAAQQQAANQQQYQENSQQPYYYSQTQPDPNRSPYGSVSTSGMSTTATSVVAYLTWIGWIISYFAGDKEGAKIHLNQCLVLYLCNIICALAAKLGSAMSIIFGIVSLGLGVLWIIGFIYACKGVQREIPLLGSIHILK